MLAQRFMPQFRIVVTQDLVLSGALLALSLAILAAPVQAATLKATYRFDGILNPDPASSDPNAPALVAIDPLGPFPPGGNRFETATVFGQPQTVYRFDGNRDTFEPAGFGLDTTGLITANNYSIEMVFAFLENDYRDRCICDLSNRSFDRGVFAASWGPLHIINQDYGDYWEQLWSPPAFGTGVFHHLVFTSDSTGNVAVYVDGKAIIAGTFFFPLTINRYGGPEVVHLFAGAAGQSEQTSADGQIGLLRVYDGILSSTEVAALAPPLPSPAPAQVRATYLFDDSLGAEEPGAPALLAVDPLGPSGASGFEDGTVFGASRRVYHFDGNADPPQEQAGLSLDIGGLIPADDYSVELVFEFLEETGRWRRILDVLNRQSDDGFYVEPGLPALQVWGSTDVGTAGTSWPTGEFHHVVLTNSPSGRVRVYMDGALEFVTLRTIAMNADPAAIMNFFLDNLVNGDTSEFADGRVALIRVYEGVLTDAQVAVQAANPFANTAPGTDVAVDLNGGAGTPGGVTVTFDDVTTGGETTITPLTGTCPAPPAGFKVTAPPTCFDLDSTATYSGPVTICFNYSALGLHNPTLWHAEDCDGDGIVEWCNITDPSSSTPDVICGTVASLSPFLIAEPDSDSDGLSDAEELALGTDPSKPDTDADGLLDGTEVEMAQGGGCPDPLDADSDDDGLSDGGDGGEVALGTNPCNPDTDGDGVGDDDDPTPTVPGVTSGWLEDAARDLATTVIPALDLGLFNGPNTNANKGRRNALANRAGEAANLIAASSYQGAIDELTSLLEKIDDATPPPDWMNPSPQKTALADEVRLLIDLLEFLVP